MNKLAIFCLMILILSGISTASRPESGAIIIDSLMYEPTPAESGSYVNVWIKVENYGKQEVDEATFTLEPTFPFSLDNNENAERFLGKLSVGEEVVLEYKVRISEDAVEGTNELKCKFTSDGSSWVTHTFDILVRTHDTMLTTQSVIINPPEVAPGEYVDVSLLLENMADSTIKDLRAELQLTQNEVLTTGIAYEELPFSPVDSTNVLMVKRLGPKEQKMFTYKLRVDPDTEPKIYRIPLTLTYSDEIGNTTYSEEGIISVVVAKTPELMINLDDSEIHTKNSQGEVILGIYNIGISKIKFAVLEILNNENYEIISTPKLYLGNVDSDDYETAEFDIYIKKENPELNFVLNYKDEYNQEHNEELSLVLKTYSTKDAKKYGFIESESVGTVILTLLFIGIGTLIYFKKIRKPKNRGKQS